MVGYMCIFKLACECLPQPLLAPWLSFCTSSLSNSISSGSKRGPVNVAAPFTQKVQHFNHCSYRILQFVKCQSYKQRLNICSTNNKGCNSFITTIIHASIISNDPKKGDHYNHHMKAFINSQKEMRKVQEMNLRVSVRYIFIKLKKICVLLLSSILNNEFNSAGLHS